MFDIGKEKIEVKCDCGRRHKASLNDVVNRKTIRCSCGININLQATGSSKKTISSINKSISELEKSLKKLGK